MQGMTMACCGVLAGRACAETNTQKKGNFPR